MNGEQQKRETPMASFVYRAGSAARAPRRLAVFLACLCCSLFPVPCSLADSPPHI